MNKIRLGAIDLSFHKVAAGVFHNVLEYFGFDVELRYETHEKMFAAQQNEEIDLLISAWLPGSHGEYLSGYEDDAIKLSPIYEPYCIWGVPDYVAKQGLWQVEDLKNTEMTEMLQREINGIGMGAGISRFSVEMIQQYGLDGYQFVSNQPDDFYKMTEEKINAGEHFIIPLWYPQYLHHQYRIVALEEPKGLLRGKDEATPILLKKAAAMFSGNQIAILSKIYLGNAGVSEMDYILNKSELDARETAIQWINANFGNLETYVAALEKSNYRS